MNNEADCAGGELRRLTAGMGAHGEARKEPRMICVAVN